MIFDIGGVLIDWNPKYLYSKLLQDEAAIEAFLAEIGFDEWNRRLDAGGLWEPAIAELVARHPHHKALIEAAHLRWHEMLPGDIPGTVAILERLSAAGCAALCDHQLLDGKMDRDAGAISVLRAISATSWCPATKRC